MHSYWRDLHVRSGCVCNGERVAIPEYIHGIVLESLHHTHPEAWDDFVWPICIPARIAPRNPHRAASCKPCTDIAKNLKPVLPESKLKNRENSSEPNEEIQKEFLGAQ